MTSDAASLSVAIAGLPVLLTQSKYSRELEAEADEYAFRLLKQKGYSPAAFAAIMERSAAKNEQETGHLAYISRHPIATERAARARQAAME
ncbi:MAG: M48 family metalloprotease [Deltaproteobacteria bacterium]|nr:M48 family metalloprotease [Deltaproteobacteria bacterium]